MKDLQKAVFGMGCFWAPDPLFSDTKGVREVFTGYMGGHKRNPTYEEVSSGTTGHAEVVSVEFDSEVVSYEELLRLFWENHDPTTINRQGPDVGNQYRSIIFYSTEDQKEKAIKSKEDLENKKDVVTEIVPAMGFYKAEEYHQKYLEKTGRKTCH